MRIKIKVEVFETSVFKNLNHLLQICTQNNRHMVFAEISKVRTLDNYSRLDKDDKQILELEYNKVVTESKIEQNDNQKKLDLNVCMVVKNEEDFIIVEAIRFLNQPLFIILENNLNDQHFIRAINKYFDKTGNFEKHYQNGWLEFANAGGCSNLENFINAKKASFNNLLKIKKYKYLRCIVILDSDRTHSQLSLEYKYSNLVKFLNDNEIAYHILEKRSMENYMPNEVFDEFRNNNTNEWINAYLNLNPLQKDFIDISFGFTGKNGDGTFKKLRGELDNNIQNLYSDVSDSNYTVLNHSFNLANFKTEFPTKFINSYNVYKETLKEMTRHQNNPNELNDIVEKIGKLL